LPANAHSAEAATKAAGSSFYAGMRLLPKAEREAMFAIYAFCRAVDDIADDGIGTRAARAAELDAWRADLDALYAGQASNRAAFLAPFVARYGLRKEDFFTVIDGMAMDVAEDIRAPGLHALDLYCDRVASAVGRLSVKVFGMKEAPGLKLAHHLGRALQLTNILRDLDEDAAVSRLYLPREFLDAAGIASRDPQAVIANPLVDKACRKLAAIAHTHYREADAVMRGRVTGKLRAPRLMGAVYSRILAKMEEASWAPPRHRVSLSSAHKLWIVLRHGLAA
jgi:presqualene diphosphate synthase